MLGTPSSGWTNISIGDWRDRASYLTDVHFDIMDALVLYLTKRKSQAVYCDAEGWEYYILFEWNAVYIITETDRAELTSIEKSIVEIAKEVYKDISNDIDAWSNWDLHGDKSEIKKNKEKILKKLSELKAAIEQYK